MTSKEFERFFKKLYLPLGMFALRIVEDAETAEDLVQDAFGKVWERLQANSEIANFSSYMYGAVRNRCLEHIRNRREFEDIDKVPEVSEEEIETSYRDAKIWNAIDKLPTKCKEVFLMSKRDGFSNEEIAEELGISIKTVKNQMTKAFARLREELKPDSKLFFLPFL